MSWRTAARLHDKRVRAPETQEGAAGPSPAVLEGAQPDERPASLTLRSQLLALVLIALVPILVLSVVLISWGVRLHRDAVDRGLTDTARALATAVDERIAVWQGALAALATSPAFDNGDFSGFYRQAADALQDVRF